MFEELREETDFSSAKVQPQYNRKSNFLVTILKGFFAIPTYLIFISIFSIYRKIVDIYLQFKLKEVYGGLLASEDVLYLIPGDVSQCSVIAVTPIKCNEKVDIVGRFRKILQEKVFDNPDNYPKLTSTIHQTMGYTYTKRNQCNVDDAIHIIEDGEQELTEEYLKKYAAKLYKTEYGKNNTMVWDIHIGARPLKSESDNVYRYPVITRFHHLVGDGTSLFSLLIQVFGENTFSENYSNDLFKKLLHTTEDKKRNKNLITWIVVNLKKVIKTTCLYIEMVFVSSGKVLEKNQLKQNDLNALHKQDYTKYSGEKICAWTVEDEIECIPLIKNIKNRQGTKFSSVLSTAIAASLSSYFKRNGLLIPEHVSGVITCLLDYPDLDMSKPVALKNKLGTLVFEMPMIYGSTTLTEALKNVSEEWEKQIYLADGLMMTLLMRTLAWIPMQILQLVSNYTAHTYVLTNVPGGSIINIQDGWVIEQLVAIAPNFLGIGVSIATLSYAGKFHIGALIDKTLVKSQKEVQKIVDDIFLYIKLLDRQTRNSF